MHEDCREYENKSSLETNYFQITFNDDLPSTKKWMELWYKALKPSIWDEFHRLIENEKFLLALVDAGSVPEDIFDIIDVSSIYIENVFTINEASVGPIDFKISFD